MALSYTNNTSQCKIATFFARFCRSIEWYDELVNQFQIKYIIVSHVVCTIFKNKIIVRNTNIHRHLTIFNNASIKSMYNLGTLHVYDCRPFLTGRR